MDTLDQDVLQRKPEENSAFLDNQQLLTAAGWARFIGIVHYVFVAFFLVLSATMLYTLIQVRRAKMMILQADKIFLICSVLTIAYLLLAVLVAFYGTATFRFGSNVKNGVYHSNMNAFAKAFQNLKRHFLFGFLVILSGLLVSVVQFLQAL